MRAICGKMLKIHVSIENVCPSCILNQFNGLTMCLVSKSSPLLTALVSETTSLTNLKNSIILNFVLRHMS